MHQYYGNWSTTAKLPAVANQAEWFLSHIIMVLPNEKRMQQNGQMRQRKDTATSESLFPVSSAGQ